VKDWFDNLEDRERRFLIVGAVTVVIVLVYALAWAPFVKRYTELESQVAVWERSIATLRPLRAAVAASDGRGGSGATASAGQSPLIVVDQTLLSRGLDRYRRNSQPTSSNGIRIVFENVAFDDLMLWLGDLSEQHAMQVQAGSFSVAARAAPGRVNATLTIERVL